MSISGKTEEASELWSHTHKLEEQISASKARASNLSVLVGRGQKNSQKLDEQIASLEEQCKAAQNRSGVETFQDREALMGTLQDAQAYMDRLSGKLECDS